MPVVINGTTGIDGPNTGGDTLINGVTVGKGAGDVATNTAMGVSVLASNTSGAQNTAFGTQALTLNTSASNNTAFGYQAGYSNTTGFGNVFVGNFAGYSSATVNYQTAFGYGSLQTSTGGGNTAIGVFALNAATTGTNNTAVGPSSGSAITTGGKNTIVGGYNGNQVGLDIRTASNYVVLSDGDGNPAGFITNARGRQWLGYAYTDHSEGEVTFSWANVSSASVNLVTVFPSLAATTGGMSVYLQVVTQSAANTTSVIINGCKTNSGGWNFSQISTVGGGIGVTASGSGTTITLTFGAGNQFGKCYLKVLTQG